MDHKTARKIKWDLVDHLLCLVHGEPALLNLSDEERQYAIAQAERFARMLNVKDHMYL